METYVQRIDPGSSMQFVPVDRPDVVFDPTLEELEVIRRAVACHESQLSPVWQAWVDDDAAFYWLARNCYLRV